MSETTCTDLCYNQGITFLTDIINNILVHVYGSTGATFIESRLRAAFNTFQCKLPTQLVNKITTISTNVISQTNTAYLVVIFITFLLLVIFNYVALLLQTRDAIIIFFALSIFIIILAAVVLYLWINSIYSTAATQIITDLNDIIKAGKEGICCLGSCSGFVCTLC